MNQAAWVILLILASGLMIGLVHGGWTGTGGAKAWFDAKFKGQTT